MAPTLGAYARIYANGYDIGPFLHSGEISGSCDKCEVTTFSSVLARRFIPGNREASVSAEGYFAADTGEIEPVMNAAFGASQLSVWCIYPAGELAIGAVGYGLTSITTQFDVSFSTEGPVECTCDASASGGRERIKSLHILGTRTATGSSASLDNGAATTNGGAVYLQATAFTGTSVTVVVEHSSDNFASDTSTLATFSTVDSGGIAERIPVSGTIKRYTRERRTSGTFTSLTHSVGIHRK